MKSAQNMNKLLTTGLKSDIITIRGSVMEPLKKALQKQPLREGDVLVITSKVVALSQGRVREAEAPEAFEALVKEEADEFLGGKQVLLTKKNSIFTPWAGIDRSNAPDNLVVLWPEKPFHAAEQYLQELKGDYGLSNLGVIISDSICAPLRRGVTGIALGYAGFKGVNDLRGQKDLYGKKMQVTQQNVADMIAAAAHLVMGETAESIPFALVRGANVEFTGKKTDPGEPVITQEDCLFAPLYKHGKLLTRKEISSQ